MTEHLTSDVADITYIESNLTALCQKPLHFKCGFYLICTQGRALVSTGVQQYALEEQTELIFLTGSLLQLVEASADLKTRILLFPQAVFLKAVLPIDNLIIIMPTNIRATAIRAMPGASAPGGK